MNIESKFIKTKTSLPIIFLGLILVFSMGLNTVSAATYSNVYVNVVTGNDSWNGQSSVWQSGVIGPKKSIKSATGAVSNNGQIYIANGQYTGTQNTGMTITKNMTLTGQNLTRTILTGSYIYHIFDIKKGVIFNIQNMTITNGKTANGKAGLNGNSGGAISNNGTLILTDTILSNNNAGNGGAGASSSTGLGKNGGNGGNGGAIYNTGKLTITNSLLSNNAAGNGGNGGDAGKGTYGAFCGGSGGKGGSGGAIYNTGTLTLTNTVLSNNNAGNGSYGGCGGNCIMGPEYGGLGGLGGFGGAVYSTGTIIMSDTILSSNLAGTGGYGGHSGPTCVNGSGGFGGVGGSGGAIYNTGTLNITSSTFSSNAAGNGGRGGDNGASYADVPIYGDGGVGGFGGAIYNNGTITIASTSFLTNQAGIGGNGGFEANGGNGGDGGAIYNIKTLNIISSTFSNNAAGNGGNGYYQYCGNYAGKGGFGGAIYTTKTLNLTNTTISNNAAGHEGRCSDTATGPYSFGGAIYNAGTCNLHFNKFYGNSASKSEVYQKIGTMNAENNWWGSNNYPDSNIITVIDGYVNIDPWIVLKISSSKNPINPSESSIITANLKYNSNNQDTSSLGAVPDDEVFFTSNNNLGNILSTNNIIYSGLNAFATFRAGNTYGDSIINVKVDNQTLSLLINIRDLISPVVINTNPADNAVNIPVNPIINIKFSEPIRSINNGIELKNSSGTLIPITSIVNGNMLTIKPLKSLNGDKYVVTINPGSITDLNGNSFNFYMSSFTVDSIPPVLSANQASGISKSNINVKLSSESCAKIYYRINNGSWHMFIGSGNVLVSNQGTNHLEFYAVDTAGNPSTHKICTYTIDKTAPKVIQTTPKKGAIGVSRTGTIYIKFSENIKNSTNWNRIYLKNLKTGKKELIKKTISKNTISIKMNLKRQAQNLYQVYIPVGAIKDTVGNNFATYYTFKFKTGKQ
ncbi:polymorphic outer membrane protein [Methanobacterium lacus]|uniref:Polymorphic outer membrane protein n=1 Tax=Methanobacterium lacus (strain AL-21) TaxID=877455 RepID=F0T8X1_METLA|nr:Ig-like domain-containing protein [Methanobacterium lacus]ADZ09799.1 polymorphic outer membrane protein [Methanobacterium lacus]